MLKRRRRKLRCRRRFRRRNFRAGGRAVDRFVRLQEKVYVIVRLCSLSHKCEFLLHLRGGLRVTSMSRFIGAAGSVMIDSRRVAVSRRRRLERCHGGLKVI